MLDPNSEASNAEKEKIPLAEKEAMAVIPAGGDQNGPADVKIDIKGVQKSFAGLTKEELMKYSNDPFWVRLRWIIFILFWLLWVGMLVGAIIIIILAPKCEPRATREWWQKGPIYQVYPSSFKDSNGDGIGDLKGLESKLDYLDDLGVKAVWLNPIYESPNKDFGYDISNFTAIDKRYGTMADFEALVAKLRSRGIELLMDLVPNHTSDKHPWFEKSVKREGKYNDYYIWEDSAAADPSGQQLPPNNWLSVFGKSAWEWHPERQQYYLHQFYKEQPDLNWRNPIVQEEFKEIMHFWLDKGIGGFRLDAVIHLVEAEDMIGKDEPPSLDPKVTDPNKYGYLEHTLTAHQPMTFTIMETWRKFVDNYAEKMGDGRQRVLLAEATGEVPDVMKYYGNGTIAHFPFNFQFIDGLKPPLTGDKVKDNINEWMESLPNDNLWPNWVLGNHDRSRVGSRFGKAFIDAFNIITLGLPGTPITYYGEEIGMVDGNISSRNMQDSSGRDPYRTPMQWDDSPHSGFSENTPWVPVNLDFETNNVKAQETERTSHLNVYKKMTKLHTVEKAFLYGDLSFPLVDTDIFSFSRIKEGSPGYLIVVNFGGKNHTLDFTKSKHIPTGEADVILYTTGHDDDILNEVKSVDLAQVTLGPKDAMVLKFNPNFDNPGIEEGNLAPDLTSNQN